MKLNELNIREAQAKLVAGEITSVDLTKACLERIKEVDEKVHACLNVYEEMALLEAREADLRREKGEKGELLGIPYIAKDNILARGTKTTAASKILENYTAPFDATIIKRLKEQGAVLLAKANLDEFAHGASTENSAFGTTHNPWDLECVPGGSSGGSAASVASDMCIFALGTDTGGSIRHPASLCNVVGLKPSYGRSSRFGLIAMTSSTDVPGPLCKNVEDSAIVLEAIAGQDKNDATTIDKEVDDYKDNLKNEIKGKKIGISPEIVGQLSGESKEIFDEAKKKFEELGAEIVEVSLPNAKYGVPVYYIITPSEISSNLGRFDGIRYGMSSEETEDLTEFYSKTRGKGFGPEVKRRIMLGTYALSAGYYDAYYLKAQKVRTVIKEELDRALEEVDVLITPTAAGPAFKIGEQSDDPLKMYLEDMFVSPPSLAGLPAVSIPAGFINDMPVGMQVIGKRFDEKTVLNFSYIFEQATDYHKKKAKL
ncbi:Asp-tRNA(Asn)/Glu-tRNA(Gln) amidotransferase GatCAB subunit A [Candidatus Parcubacteria bacterium]|nr:MAG: Asp-tRNA(Asn)/Glu-tRNA(Gln) amidotransferase GatCAB subunit A [Candidatus Parcubacteria bacterium]